jgi:hypothetical protein
MPDGDPRTAAVDLTGGCELILPLRDAVGYGAETGMRMTTRSSVPTVLVM